MLFAFILQNVFFMRVSQKPKEIEKCGESKRGKTTRGFMWLLLALMGFHDVLLSKYYFVCLLGGIAHAREIGSNSPINLHQTPPQTIAPLPGPIPGGGGGGKRRPSGPIGRKGGGMARGGGAIPPRPSMGGGADRLDGRVAPTHPPTPEVVCRCSISCGAK